MERSVAVIEGARLDIGVRKAVVRFCAKGAMSEYWIDLKKTEGEWEIDQIGHGASRYHPLARALCLFCGETAKPGSACLGFLGEEGALLRTVLSYQSVMLKASARLKPLKKETFSRSEPSSEL